MISAVKALVIVIMFLGGVGAWVQSYTPDLLRRAERGARKPSLISAWRTRPTKIMPQAATWYRRAALAGRPAQRPAARHLATVFAPALESTP